MPTFNVSVVTMLNIAPDTYPISVKLPGVVESVAEIVFIVACKDATVVLLPPRKFASSHTSQSPAVRDIDVILAGVTVVRETADPEAIVELTYSPTLPAVALSFVTVPTIPFVPLNEMLGAVSAPVSVVVPLTETFPDAVSAPVSVVVPLTETFPDAVSPARDVAPVTVKLARVVVVPRVILAQYPDVFPVGTIVVTPPSSVPVPSVHTKFPCPPSLVDTLPIREIS
jgi:hypothetical protein